MSQLSYAQPQYQDGALWLRGNTSQLKIERAADQVWRLLHYHRYQDRQKGSWSLERTPPLDFEAQLEPETQSALLRAEGLTDLELNFAPYALSMGSLQVLHLSSAPVVSPEQALPRLAGTDAEEDPHIFDGHPVRDLLDGLPLGAGMSMEFELRPDMRFYGLGERTGFLNKRGRRWHNWTTDQFFHLPKADPLYQSHPFVLIEEKGRWLGVYLDESWYSCFDLGFTSAQRWQIHCNGPSFDLYLIDGASPQDILQQYIALVGKAPMPPLWALGQHQCRWSYPDQESVSAIVEEYRERELPLDAVWMDIDYMSSYKVFTFSTHRFPDVSDMCSRFAEQGVKTVLIVDPGVKQEKGYSVYEAGKAIDAYVHDVRDEDFVGEVWPKPVVWPDFTHPEVRRWWGDQHDFYLQHGIAGIWNDMNEPAAFKLPNKTLPLDARQGPYSHAEVHNLYGYHMAQATYEGLKRLQPNKRPFVLTRSGCPGIQRYAWVWTGDNASYWEHLEMSIPMIMNLSLSAVPLSGADIGGFSSDCDGELLAAWSWLGACYPFMRNHAGKRSRRQEPWQFGEPWLGYVRKALDFRYQILPYLYTLCHRAHTAGDALFRPLLYDYPDDREVLEISDQFLLGPDLLVAPILRPGQTRRCVYFPAGEWYDFWSGQRFAGRAWHMIEVSLERLPLFQRAGSAVPLHKPQLHTTDAHWSALCWQIAPADHDFEGRVYCDAGDGPVDGYVDFLRCHKQGEQLQLTREDQRQQVEIRRVGQQSQMLTEATAFLSL